MTDNAQTGPLAQLADQGISLWLDDLSRQRLTTGNLLEIIDSKNIVGVTTNPSIFAAALADESYEPHIAALADRGASVDAAVRELTTDDVRAAADLFAGVYHRSHGVDGRVSIEVDPRLAHDTAATIEQAKELFKIVDRNNVLIKIPATLAGLPAITAVIGEGISVNVTLIFSLDRYAAVIDAYIEGLEQAQANGHNLSHIHSVASFFVSRVDLEIDKRLKVIDTPQATALLGKAAIANARLAYQLAQQKFTGDRWAALAAAGANPQRPLWASTGVKDPAYDDTRYVVELVAPGAVNTAPEGTIDAVADHGSDPRQHHRRHLRRIGLRVQRPAGPGNRPRRRLRRAGNRGCAEVRAGLDQLLTSVNTTLQQATTK